MVSESDLVARLGEILRSSDLNTTTPGNVRRQLEKDFGVDLSDRKRFISQQIDEFLESHMKNEDGDGEDVPDEEVNGTAGTEEEDGSLGGVVEEEEEGENEEDEVDKRKRSKKKGTSNGDSQKKKRGGFTKLCSLSPQLQDFLGTSKLARTEVVKQMWVYIRANDLQDPRNRKIIRCDEKLRAIFRVEKIDMFQMNKALTKHIWPLEADESHVASPSKEISEENQNEREKEEEDKPKAKPKRQKASNSEEDELKTKPKRQKGSNSGLTAPLTLSDALKNFLGTGETQLARTDVVKRMWEYIKKNNLQDPSDKRRILCDDKLKELFDVDSFIGFSVTKLLTSHFIKAEQ